MNRKFESNSNVQFQKSYEDKKSRSFTLGVKAIDSLIRDGKPVTLRTISERSKEIDETGIHPNTIKNNEDLNEYYLKHTTSSIRKGAATTHKIRINDSDFRNISTDRDLERVKRRYLQMKKSELVEMLINAEQYIAEQNKGWLRSQFEIFK